MLNKHINESIYTNSMNVTVRTKDVFKNDKIPDPRGKKSFPTMLSRTEDFPELYKPQKNIESLITNFLKFQYNVTKLRSTTGPFCQTHNYNSSLCRKFSQQPNIREK